MKKFSNKELSDINAEVFSESDFKTWFMAKYRPFICPFTDLISSLGTRQKILDIGSGSGSLLFTLKELNLIHEGVGVDVKSPCVVALEKFKNKNLSFISTDGSLRCVNEQFDAVVMIDVMHHIMPSQQEIFFKEAISKLKRCRESRLIYKDISSKQRFRSFANRVHDLIVAREWIHYVLIEDIVRWADESGLKVVEEGKKNMLVYPHEWRVFAWK